MAMDYGSSFTGDMGQEAIQAAESTLTQAKADWPSTPTPTSASPR